MFYFIVSIILLFIILCYRIINNKKSIVYYVLICWIMVNCFELLSSIIMNTTNMTIEGLFVNVIVGFAAVVSSFFYKSKSEETKFSVDIHAFYFFLGLFLISALDFVVNYYDLFSTYGFNLTYILQNRSELLSNSIFSYFFMFGIACTMMLPYANLLSKQKYRYYLLILIPYVLNPQRNMFYLTMIIIFYNEVIKQKKLKYRYYLIFIAVFLTLFHTTQVLLNKSVYENEWMHTIGKYNHIEATILDASVYVNGNISNTGIYLKQSSQDGQEYFLNNTLYPFYVLAHNAGLINESPKINNYFIDTGLFSTNTINMVTYYIGDCGYVYAVIMIISIFILLEKISNKKSKFSTISYPIFLAIGILSFRENDLIFIYFYITIVIIYLSTRGFKLKLR